jgi:hypothetical protein
LNIFLISLPTQNCLKQEDVLPPLLSNFAFEYAIKKVQENWVELKINGTHELLAYADYMNLLGGNIETIKRKRELLGMAVTNQNLI